MQRVTEGLYHLHDDEMVIPKAMADKIRSAQTGAGLPGRQNWVGGVGSHEAAWDEQVHYGAGGRAIYAPGYGPGAPRYRTIGGKRVLVGYEVVRLGGGTMPPPPVMAPPPPPAMMPPPPAAPATPGPPTAAPLCPPGPGWLNREPALAPATTRLAAGGGTAAARRRSSSSSIAR